MNMYAFQSPVAVRTTRLSNAILISRTISTRGYTTCSLGTYSRRTALQLASLALASTILPSNSNALSLLEIEVSRDVSTISEGLKRAKALKDTVLQYREKMTEEDTLVVLRNVPIWFSPAQIAMKEVSETKANVGDVSVLQTLATATFGHLLELRMEAKGGDRGRVIREIDEFIETSEEFLAVPGLKRFKK